MPTPSRSCSRSFPRSSPAPAGPCGRLAAPIETLTFDLGSVEPVEDEVFEVFQGLHTYDPGDLEVRIESVDDSERHWQRERITFNAAYGGERILAYLMIPKDAWPPYQTVVFFPPGGASQLRSSEVLSDTDFWDFRPRSGRAVMYPVYKETDKRHAVFEGGHIAPIKDAIREILDWLDRYLGPLG